MGIGEAIETSFRVPEGSVGYWTHRFLEKGVAHHSIEKRFGESVLAFKDTDGTGLALVAVRGIGSEPGWSGGEVPPEHAIRGFRGVKLLLRESGPTGAILTDVFGFSETAREGSVVRFKAGETRRGGIVDIHVAGDFLRGRLGGGSVHHIAFRAADDAAQFAMRDRLSDNHGIRTTEQKDRNYFGHFISASRRRAVRDRDRYSGVRPGRARGGTRPVVEAAATIRAAPRGDRDSAARPFGLKPLPDAG